MKQQQEENSENEIVVETYHYRGVKSKLEMADLSIERNKSVMVA